MAEPVYIIGIDLGTTNSVVSYTTIESPPGQPAQINVMSIPQTVEPGVVEAHSMLPSFILAPGPHDVPEKALSLPWEDEGIFAVGEFAKKRGAEIPHRMIASSKSWLCHSLVDRNKPILPWKSPEDCPKLSPVEASSLILRHIRNAWNHTIARDEDTIDERLLMENQDIFLTVPASFDAVARELTVKAAISAGLTQITLLEEPQAAFYAWIYEAGEQWRELVREGDRVLVCDIGGGTSDFSMIQVSQSEGELVLERIAVGEHLLVGGDNMDLAMAYGISQKLSQQGTKINSNQLQGLWHSCRNAKERLFSDSDLESVPLTLLGSGSSLIGGTIKTELVQSEIETAILNGFLPNCPYNAAPQATPSAGIRELGLSYEADPAITRHLANFIRHTIRDEDTSEIKPSAVLFNGGVMKASPLRSRIVEVLNGWQSETGDQNIRELISQDYDLAVAKGAAYYGLARRGQGIRIRSGLGKSYYLGIAASMPAVPGMPAPVKALCVAPFGMEEGTEVALSNQEFVLVVGEPVKFEFLNASSRFDDVPGDIIEDWSGEIAPITTLEATLEGELGAAIPVTMEIKVTEVGTLEIWCVSKENQERWKLEFNVRERDSRLV